MLYESTGKPLNADTTRALKRARFVGDQLDRAFHVPGTRIRFGYDALVGLVPVVGDTVTALVGLYPVYEGVRHHARKRVVAKMLLNLGIDWLIGLIPLVDVVFDVAYKANVRNVRLLSRELQRQEHV